MPAIQQKKQQSLKTPSIRVDADKLDSSPEFSGKVSIEQFSPKQLAATLGTALPKMKEEKALHTADAKLTL